MFSELNITEEMSLGFSIRVIYENKTEEITVKKTFSIKWHIE